MAGSPTKSRPLVAVWFRGVPEPIKLPLRELEQQADGQWRAVVLLPRWADDGDADTEWDEWMRVPPGQFKQVAGEDYAGLKRIPHPLRMR